MKDLHWYILTGVFTLLTLSLNGQSSSRFIKQADDFFEHARYREALQAYRDGGSDMSWDKQTRLRVGICRYEVNDLDGALSILTELDRDVKTPPDVFFYMARIYQHKLMFENAVKSYKSFIRESKTSDGRRAWVKDEIMRCSYGMSAKYIDQLAYVENLGTSLNTFYDEFGPVPSPLYANRLYFSSARPGTQGGLKDPMNIDDEKYGVYGADMFYSENQNGIWRTAQPMGGDLNSTRDDIIYGFSGDGQQLFYFSGEENKAGRLIIDTFGIENAGSPSGSRFGPFEPERGDKDLFLFNDTIILFSSARLKGSGGYDIHFSVKRRGVWLEATNLGPRINSFYDDTTPFLTKNGRRLYFSSNRKNSIGGLDIFSSEFNDSTASWGSSTNLGIPINSAGDDSHFFIGGDGLSAYFSSDRKTGFGLNDIYAAYMKEAIESHLAIEYPVSFIQLLPTDSEGADMLSPIEEEDSKVMEYFLGDLAYEPNDLVLTPQNLRKLEVLANLLLIYPTLKADLICHDAPSGPASYDLYFSIKKAEQVADYLARKGVDRNRMYIKGCGAFYQRAQVGPGEAPNPSLDRLNRRIEVQIYETQGLPIALTYEKPNIPNELMNQNAVEFSEMQADLVFRVQIAAVGQMFQNEIFDQETDAMVIWDSQSRIYKYTLGQFKDYESAEAYRNDLRTRGFGDAFVIAFIKGKQVRTSEIDEMGEDYPELLELKGSN